MAKITLLDTRAINFLELLGNGRIYRVPPYQRDYSWEEEQWEDLWNDIQELRKNREVSHYMGALVVEGKSDREFLIIDGQQRLATLSILALVVISKLKELADRGIDPQGNRERADSLRSRFIGEKDPASLIESSKLFLNETDDAFYQDYLVQLRKPINPRGLGSSNLLLWQCFIYFNEQINSIPEFATKGQLLTELLSETIARQLIFILITVDNELNAYTVFETLNARGLELSSTDLLKNYLFSLVKVSSDLNALQRRWRSLITKVRQERFPEFLRYHLLCTEKTVRKQRLFKLIRDKIKAVEDVFSLIDLLEQRAEIFSAISDIQHSYWIEYPDCKPFIRELNLFQVRQMMPLLFAAWECFTKADFARVLRVVSIISFRHVIVSHLNPNVLEEIYHLAAKAILSGSANSLQEVFQILKVVYVPDDKFEQDFSRLSFKTNGGRKKLAKYILTRLEGDLSGRACDPDTDPATIEHILPENPSAAWDETFPSAIWERMVYQLGNLTLLESSANRALANAVYAEKVNSYGLSNYALSHEVQSIAPEQWTPDLLQARQQQLAKRAVHLWRIDF
jgi:uncharacterized protein with ParB-like and HNH nuclease domain